MPIEVKTAEVSAQKWNERASGAGQAMADGAVAAAPKWAANTAKAADNYRQAVTSGNIAQRFAAGVRKAGAEKFSRNVIAKAAARYSSGINAAQGDYQNGVAPYLQTISGLTLSPRKPRGDPSNYNRVAEVGRALNTKRIAMLGSGS